MGWSGKKNGELLQLMASQGFDVLITVDQGIRYQQNPLAVGVAVIVLVAPSSRLVDLLPLVPSALASLASIKPGDVVEIHA
jgi:hypothetical protein